MNREIHVFLGPSWHSEVLPQLEGFVFHPPVAQGDVYAITERRPLAIAIVDGYFERVPAVWHKEILWALSQGIHVFGAASMGALRAAELADFGMLGIGAIFESFVSGELCDDDEVTIVHAEQQWGYRPGSEAMVNIRATLARAVQEGVIAQSSADSIIARAKLTFYPDRTYPTLLKAAETWLPQVEWEGLSQWLADADNRVDQKKTDTRQLLAHLQQFRSSESETKRVPWMFQHTDAWEQVRRRFRQRQAELKQEHADMPVPATVNPGNAEKDAMEPEYLIERARLRKLEIEAARRDGYQPSEHDVKCAAMRFRQARGLETEQAMLEFLRGQGMTPGEFERLMAEEACVYRSRLLSEPPNPASLNDVLRLSTKHDRHLNKPTGNSHRPDGGTDASVSSGRSPGGIGVAN